VARIVAMPHRYRVRARVRPGVVSSRTMMERDGRERLRVRMFEQLDASENAMRSRCSPADVLPIPSATSMTPISRRSSGQHLHAWVLVDKVADTSRERKHDAHGGHHGDHHDDDVPRHPTAVMTESSENTTSSARIWAR